MSTSVLLISKRHVDEALREPEDPLLMHFLEDQPGLSDPSSCCGDDSTYMGQTGTNGRDDGADYNSD